MFSLPKPSAKSNQKNPNKSYTSHHSEIHRKPNINQIKQEIQFILKRNNSPLSFNVDKEQQKSHNNIHHHLLQRKKTKILQRAHQQNIEKAKNNRKIYEEYLMGDLAPKTYSKTIEPKQNSHHFHLKQTFFSRQLQKDISNSKVNFNSSQALELLRKQKKSQSMFTDKEIQHLGMGKLLFYKDSKIKLKRSSLLQGRTLTNRKSLFKDTAIQSFYHEPSLDITRYLKHFDKSSVEEDETKVRKPEQRLLRQNSLEIFRKDIIPKESPSQQIILSLNPQSFGVQGTHKDYVQHPEKQAKRLTKYDISPHFKDKGQEMRQTLNVMDEELLVYYGKMKNRKSSRDYLPSVTHRTTILQHPGSNDNQSSLSKFFDIGARTSIEIKKLTVKQQSWRFQHFDPWEKHKHEEQLDHEDVFGKLESYSTSLCLQQSHSKHNKTDQSQ